MSYFTFKNFILISYILIYLSIKILAINEVKSKHSSFENQATVVSAYYILKYKYSEPDHLEWIRNFMMMKFRSVIFCDTKSHSMLIENYPENNMRKYVIREFENFTTSRWVIITINIIINYYNYYYFYYCNCYYYYYYYYYYFCNSNS